MLWGTDDRWGGVFDELFSRSSALKTRFSYCSISFPCGAKTTQALEDKMAAEDSGDETHDEGHVFVFDRRKEDGRSVKISLGGLFDYEMFRSKVMEVITSKQKRLPLDCLFRPKTDGRNGGVEMRPKFAVCTTRLQITTAGKDVHPYRVYKCLHDCSCVCANKIYLLVQLSYYMAASKGCYVYTTAQPAQSAECGTSTPKENNIGLFKIRNKKQNWLCTSNIS